MTNKTELVFNGYLNLSDDEKRELRLQIEKYERNDFFEKGNVRERFSESVKRIMGPTSASFCPSCGRG